MYKIKLLESRGLTGRYAVLSHCWDQDMSLLKTTNDTLSSHLEGIHYSLPPKTFQDAVEITESLEISYLWIDSLCIIQGDAVDWKAEAGKMEDVYSNSLTTLAATGSSSSRGGCLFPRRHATDYEVSIPHEVTKSQSERVRGPDGIKFRYWSRSHMHIMGEHLSTTIGGAPLLTRSWILQERLLSPIFLHFHEEELVWECQEGMSCECGFLDW
jgi:hypothetical protein